MFSENIEFFFRFLAYLQKIDYLCTRFLGTV